VRLLANPPRDCTLTVAARACSALYKLRDDSSGPNFGPMSAAEMAELDGMTEEQLLHPPRARGGERAAQRERRRNRKEATPVSSLSDDSGAAQTDTSDGSDDESDGADSPAEVAHPRKQQGWHTGKSSAYRGVCYGAPAHVAQPRAKRQRAARPTNTYRGVRRV
jgi:hypothetical protein